MLAAVGVSAALILCAAWIGRNLWFFSDDWNIYADYHSGNLLEPFNGHLSLVPAGLYQMAFHTVGVDSYVPYRILGLVALGVLAFQAWRFAGRQMGPWVAVVAVAAVLWNSAGVTNVMFPFLMNFSLPIAALLAIWWHLDALEQQPGHRASLVAIGLWTALALATSGLGVVLVGAVIVELLLRRARPATWLALALPSLAWFAWWLGHREANEISTDIGQVVPYLLRMLWAGTTAVAAGWKPGGLLLAGLLVAVVVAATVHRRRLDARVGSALTAAFAFAALTALTRQDTIPPIPPDELRYGWTIGAFFVFAALAAGCALLRTEDDQPGLQVRTGATLGGATVATVVLVIGAAVLVDDMGDWSDTVEVAAPGLRSNIYAAEAAGADRLDPGTVIRPLSFVPVTAGAYLDAVASVGSPLAGATDSDIGGRTDQRTAADELFFGAVELDLAVVDTVVAAERDCGAEMTALPGSTVLVEAAPATGGRAIEDQVVALSRFGEEPVVELVVGAQVVAHTLVLPEDAPVGTEVVVPYRLKGSDGVRVCVDARPPGP